MICYNHWKFVFEKTDNTQLNLMWKNIFFFKYHTETVFYFFHLFVLRVLLLSIYL
jgi:hypothetical protein